LKILHLQTEINKTCGISRTIFLIIKNSTGDIEHSIVTFGGDNITYFIKEKIDILQLPLTRKSVIGTVKTFLFLWKYCSKNQIDIIHSHHRYFDLLCFCLSGIINIKTITSVHSKVYGLRSLSYKADKLIAAGVNIREHLINYYKKNPNKVEVIQNFVDFDYLRLSSSGIDLKKSLNLPDDFTTIGFVGRISRKEKGIDILLKAFYEISKKLSNIYLLLVGNGEDAEFVELFIKEKKMTALLVKENNSVADFYNIIDLFILPSRVDPFPLVMLESGAMKIPFIGSNVDGIKEYINDGINGLLFKNEDVADLVEKIEYLLKNKEFAFQLGVNLFRKVKDNNTVENILPKYEKLYKRLCNQ
jgi:glycosyltransferase involved in cell wall biosynthesis